MNTYKLILTDNPWKYSNYKKTKHGAPQYKTMTIEDMCKIPVGEWADKDCIMLFWTTFPFLEKSFEVINKWGFSYITGFPWVKSTLNGSIRRGIGFWVQSTSELLLICKKGKPTRKTPRSQTAIGLVEGEEKLFVAPINKHSRKPEGIHEWAELTFEGPYLELFATQTRENWTCWGLDTGYFLSEKGVELVDTK